MKKWATQVDKQRRVHREMKSSTATSSGTSSHQFYSLSDHERVMKSYRQEEEYEQNNFDDMSSV